MAGRRKKKVAFEAAVIDKGTPATRAENVKTKESTIDKMLNARHRSGKHRDVAELRRAAEEIYFVYQGLFVSALGMHTSSMERVDNSGEGEVPVRLSNAYTRRWRPWTERLGPPFLNIIISVVVDRWTLGDIAARYAHRHEWASQQVIHGLRCYAIVAGWLEETPQEQYMNRG